MVILPQNDVKYVKKNPYPANATDSQIPIEISQIRLNYGIFVRF